LRQALSAVRRIDRADPRLIHVAIVALAAVRKSRIGDQPASDASQNFCVRIIDFIFLSDRSILVRGVSLLY
jgi:hypothetical protein